MWNYHIKTERSNCQHPANKCMLKVSNKNTRKRCEILSKLTLNTPVRRECCSGVISDFEYISYLFLVFLLLALKR